MIKKYAMGCSNNGEEGREFQREVQQGKKKTMIGGACGSMSLCNKVHQASVMLNTFMIKISQFIASLQASDGLSIYARGCKLHPGKHSKNGGGLEPRLAFHGLYAIFSERFCTFSS